MLSAQPGEGGFPAALGLGGRSGDFNSIQLQAPAISEAVKAESGKSGAYLVGEGIKTNIDLNKEGTWSFMNDTRILRLGIGSENARGLVLYYSSFSIPDGGSLFVYTRDGEFVIGAFTSRNNPAGRYFATEMIPGSELVIEYNAPAGVTDIPEIEIYEVHYIFRDIDPLLKGLSGPCEVNVNCPEGDNWQNEKRAVAKILLKQGSNSYLCTGSLVNNTRQDSTPYFLTARHCGSEASANDYSQWVFYFNFEAQTCENPMTTPSSNSISGCELLAEAPNSTYSGSDFKLLRINQGIPEVYNPYFAGWDRSGTPSSSGVGIHHPAGDIKKISTYTSTLVSTDYSQQSPNPNGYYWKVVWAPTITNHGVTEGGSSGSPIFDPAGRIVGTLTGGYASCYELTAPDYYGKFSYHWVSNGSSVTSQLRPYLDPDNTGVEYIDGFGYGNLLEASFRTDDNVISIGSTISFHDESTGEPEGWTWHFPGAEINYSEQQNPEGITYNMYGEFAVSLEITKNGATDNLTRSRYIHVTPNLWPVPAIDHVYLDFGSRELEFMEAELYDAQGRLVMELSNHDLSNGIFRIQLEGVQSGAYFLKVKTNIQEDVLSFVVAHGGDQTY